MRKPALILTHNDMDGWCAGAIARLALLAHGEPEPEIRHGGYGMTYPVGDAVERQVFVLDFSWPLDDMLALHGAAEQLTWIDHHPQPVKDGRRYVDAVNERGDTGAITVLRTDRCGAWLTWEELRDAFIVRQMPFVIELVDDYDRWVHALNETKAFKNGVDALAQGHGAAWSEWEGLLAEHSTHPNSRSGDVIRTGKILLLAQAERLCVQVLRERPQDPDALRIMGLIALKQDRQAEALELVGQASSVRPDDPEILAALGLVYTRSGQPARAETCFRRVLVKVPERAEILADLATVLQEQGKLPEAEAALRRAVEMEPDLVQGWFNLGVQISSSQPAEAVACFRRAQALSPDDWEIKSNLALLLGLLFGQHEEAEQLMERASLLDPGNPSVCINLSALRLNRGDFAGAEEVAAEAAALLPRQPQPLINLGLARLGLGRHAEAVLTFVEAISLAPDDAQAHLSLGRALFLEGKVNEAVQRYTRAEQLDPGAGALALAQARLLQGQYDREAWAGLIGFAGDEPPPLKGLVLLRGDAGLAQALLLLRFVPALRQRGVQAALQCPPPVRRLLQASGLVDQLLEPGALPAQEAAEVDLAALPLLLDVGGPEDAAPTYLTPDLDEVAAWRTRLGGGGRPRVGLLWTGEDHDGDPHQWIPLSAMRPLLEQGGVEWFSLQYGASEQELQLLAALGVTDLADDLQDVAEGLAVMAALDLVITPDNAMAHLAGAAAVPAWILLRTAPNWCWGLQGDSTPWYPSLRLFRRQTYGPWDDVLDEVGQALKSVT